MAAATMLSSLALLCIAEPAHSFNLPPRNNFFISPTTTKTSTSSSTTALFMAKTKAKKKKKQKAPTSSSGGLKGFGSSSPSSKSTEGGSGGTIDRSPSALRFYDYLQRNGGGDNLKRVGLGHFPLRTPDGAIIPLRGVVALRDVKKGDPIIEIPYEMALDLGRESADPTLPATVLLQKYCAWNCGSDAIPPGDRGRGEYFSMLPPYMSEDCMGSTDFFTDGALDMLQSPMVVEETLLRRGLVEARYERDVEPMLGMSSNLYRWDGGDGGDVATTSHLAWASWIVTSRVLTVQGPPESNVANRLLIPLVDMCNHDRDSPHVLTGRAMPGGMLKVVAGADVKEGEQVNIGYGGSVEGNDRFVQDYGFLDSGGSGEVARHVKKGGDGPLVPEAYRIVAKKILGRGRTMARMSAADQQRELDALGKTSLEDDEALLGSGSVTKSDERAALEYRIGMKRALRELM